MLVRLLYSTAALLILVTLGLCGQISPLRKFQMLVLDESRITCSVNMACRLAICPWQQMQTISQDYCVFVDNHCTCPESTICIATNNYIPDRNNLVTFRYVCRSPSVLLQRQNYQTRS